MSRFPRDGRPGASLPWWRRLRFLDVVLLTSIPATAALYLLWLSTTAYYRARLFDDGWSKAVQIHEDFAARIRLLRNTPALVAADRKLDPEGSDPAIIRLLVPGDQWQNMLSTPFGGFSWVEATLDRSGNGVGGDAVEIRKRGDNSIHWLSPKVSLTLRTSRENLFKGYRTVGLSVKDVLPQYLTNTLPSRFGLLAARTEVVPVFVNKRFNGLYRLTEVVDESMLRAAGSMPGNVYRGDAAERGEYYKHLPRGLFRNVNIWDRVSFNERPTAPVGDGLPTFLALVNGTTFDEHLRLFQRVDQDEMARLLAALLVAGDPLHMDGVHNQYWYENPVTGLLSIIPWDIRLLALDEPAIPVNEFWQKALRDPFLVDATLRAARVAIVDQGLERWADSLVHAVYSRFEPYFAYEKLREGVIPSVGSPDEVMDRFQANLQVLDRWFADAQFAALAAAPSAGGRRVLDLESRGMTGADLRGLTVPGGDRPPVLRADRNRDGALDAADPMIPGRWTREGSGWTFAPADAIALLPGWDLEGRGIRPGRLHYRFFLEGAADGPVALVLTNRLTGVPVVSTAFTRGEPLAVSRSFSPWQYPDPPAGRRLDWSGDMHLRETQRLASSDTVRIAPGTTIRLDPDVSLVFRGPVIAAGTRERPIRIVRADSARPWGTVALQGRGADHSRFSFVQFVGGGGAIVDRIEYIGAINVHLSRDILFEDCLFADNVRSDDMLHILAGEFVMRRCHMRRANSDGVDMDMATGWIEDNRIEDSGGDGIDLMGSTPRIVGNQVLRSGDKGISVGEASDPIVVGNYLAGNTRGIEVKDGSEPLLIDNLVESNAVGLRLDRKNWRYGAGGWARTVGTVVRDNRTAIVSDSVSRITIVGAGNTSDLGTVLAREAGIGIPSGEGPGLPASWWRTDPAVPLLEQAFRDGFGRLDPWTADRTGERLDVRHGLLTLWLEASRGSMRRPVTLDVPATGRYLLVAEVGGRDLTRITVEAISGRDTVRKSVAPFAAESQLQFVALPLPPGRYGTVRITGDPVSRLIRARRETGLLDVKPALLHLRRITVIGLPDHPEQGRSP